MDSAALSAAIAGATAVTVAIATAGLTYYLTKRRERESDWRKLKLERYGEYVTALSGVVKGQDPSAEAQARYADAVNSLALVAPRPVLEALYAFLDERSVGPKKDELLNELMNAVRRDIYPSSRRWHETIADRFVGVPPRSTPGSNFPLDKST